MSEQISLAVHNLDVRIGEKVILRNINLEIGRGRVHAVMGPNGSGKSTLLYGLMAHPAYAAVPHDTQKPLSIRLDGGEISGLSTQERAEKGLFLALQSPIGIPGVSVVQILRSGAGGGQSQAKTAAHNPVLFRKNNRSGTMVDFVKKIRGFAEELKISPELLNRGIHDGFSGGERKKIEILEALVIAPKVALFDEIDTGLDVDALKIVAAGIRTLNKNGTTIVIVTHYQRILKYIEPDKVHVLVHGSVIATGGKSLSGSIDRKGYGAYAQAIPTE